MKIGALMVCRNESIWCDYTIEMVSRYVEVIAIARGLRSWNGNFDYLDDTDRKIKSNRHFKSGLIKYVEIEKPESDESHRNQCLQILRDSGCDIVWVVDFDEFYHDRDIERLFEFVKKNGPASCGQIYVNAFAYWRGLGYRSIAQERFGPVLFNLRNSTKFNYIRNIDQDPGYTLDISLHHMTAVKTDQEMYEKINGWSHSKEVVGDWYKKKWLGWLKDRNITNLHPVSPGLWPKIIKIDKSELPSILHTHPWFDRDIVR